MQTVAVKLTMRKKIGGRHSRLAVEGMAYEDRPGLAITPSCRPDEEDPPRVKWDGWSISHINSGVALLRYIRTPILARKLMLALPAWIDWSLPLDDVLADPAMTAAYEAWRDGIDLEKNTTRPEGANR